MADFFISYNVADLKKAEWIAWILREAGYFVRFAHWEIGVGGDIAQWMDRALQESAALIGVASPDYLKPGAKYSALERAAMLWQDISGEERRLIFVKVRPCALPVIYAARLYIDFAGATRDKAKELLLEGVKGPTIPVVEPQFETTAVAPSTRTIAAEPEFAVVAPAPRIKLVDTSALTDTSLVTLRGRDSELAKLDAAWADPNIHVISVVAWGGQGKTALVSVWADRADGRGRARGRRHSRLVLLQPGHEGAGDLRRSLSRLGTENPRPHPPRPQRDIEGRSHRRGVEAPPRSAHSRRRRAFAARAGAAGRAVERPGDAFPAAARRR